ncbi:MAG: helix-turn-helix domain-containing protein [Clostridia bacterium]|nr:helix-turn-helix domain-containing protein [Clostridia bacterium]
MEFKDIIVKLRRERGLSQDDLAARLYLTRQAISRWENGYAMPNVETLKALSTLFDVSINTLLGSPREPVCQCCGMPLTDADMARDPDHTVNEDYCRYCRVDGTVQYRTLDEMVDFLVKGHFIPGMSDEAAEAFYREQLPMLQYWREQEAQA